MVSAFARGSIQPVPGILMTNAGPTPCRGRHGEPQGGAVSGEFLESQRVLHAREEGPLTFDAGRLSIERGRKLFEELALLGRQLLRRHHLHGDDLVAAI